MKIQWLVLASVTLWPACGRAQTPTASSTTASPASSKKPAPKRAPLVIEPAAQAILDRATQSYQGLGGISFNAVRTMDSRKGHRDYGSVLTRYLPPNKIHITERIRRSVTRVVGNGSSVYSVVGSEYYTYPGTPESVASMMTSRSNSGQIIGAMMKGKNPFVNLYGVYSHLPPPDFKASAVVSLGPRLVDGDVLQGVQYSYSAHFAALPGEEAETLSDQITAWFGGSPFLLRRVQSRAALGEGGDIITVGEKIIDQQLSPTFAEDTFKWDDTGLKPASREDDNKPYWDSRLKVGATPFAFSAQGLQGQTISLEKYKGKVLLMDFWATWCGPCVAGIPEIKTAYDKYHKQGLEVVGISSDETPKELASFIKTRKMPWPQIFDREKEKSPVSDLYGVKAIPFLLIIGRNGKIAAINPRGNIDAAVKAALAKG